MKKIIIVLLLCVSFGYGQESFESYYNPLADVKYQIEVEHPDKKGNYTFLIECKSIDSRSKNGALIINNKQLLDFKEHLSYLKDIFIKWKKTAEENKVTDINKEIEYKNKFYNSAFTYGDWHFDFNTKLTSYFKYVANKYYVVIYSPKLTSSSNQYIKSDGYMLSFSSPEDFDDLINKLDETKVIEYYKEKDKKEDLFKN